MPIGCWGLESGCEVKISSAERFRTRGDRARPASQRAQRTAAGNAEVRGLNANLRLRLNPAPKVEGAVGSMLSAISSRGT